MRVQAKIDRLKPCSGCDIGLMVDREILTFSLTFQDFLPPRRMRLSVRPGHHQFWITPVLHKSAMIPPQNHSFTLQQPRLLIHRLSGGSINSPRKPPHLRQGSWLQSNHANTNEAESFAKRFRPLPCKSLIHHERNVCLKDSSRVISHFPSATSSALVVRRKWGPGSAFPQQIRVLKAHVRQSFQTRNPPRM